MVKINLFITHTEEQVIFEANNSSEFNDYVTTRLKQPQYNLLLENGEKIAKKKIQKLDLFLENNLKGKETIDVVIITGENFHNSSALTTDENKKLNNVLNQIGFNSDANPKLKKIMETILFFNNEIKKFENQQIIFKFISSFHKRMQEKIHKRFFTVSDSNTKFKNKKFYLEKNFDQNIKSICENLSKKISLQFENLVFMESEFNFVRKSYSEFHKLYSIFEEKFTSFLPVYNNFSEKCTNKLKENNIHSLETFKDIIAKVSQMYAELQRLIKDQTKPRENFVNIETFWKNSKFESSDNLAVIYKLRKANSLKIKNLLDDDFMKTKLNILEKLSEITFYKTRIEENLEITTIPEVFEMEVEQIEKEIFKRRQFECTFNKLTEFLNTKLVFKEEKRRKIFSDKMIKYCKHDTYKLLFEKLYSKYLAPEHPKKFQEKINLIDKNLNSLLDFVYDDHEESEDCKYNNIIDVKMFASYEEKLANVEKEIKTILLDNFKMKPSDDLDLSKKSSDVIIIDKDFENFNNGNGRDYQEILNQNYDHFSEILKNLKKLREVSKPPDNSVNLDISCTSMINSIYISNFQESKKSEVEKFYMQHEDKLYFFDALFEYMNNFISNRKLNYIISREKPQSLGILIETILKDWVKSRTLSDKYKTKLKQLISINKI